MNRHSSSWTAPRPWRQVIPAVLVPVAMALAICLSSTSVLAQPDTTAAQPAPVPGAPPPDSAGVSLPPPPRQVRAVRIHSEAPAMDGRLDEPVWREAVFVSDFLQKDPNEGQPVTEKTEVGILYDDDAIYVGARMQCPRPTEHIRATVSRRDQTGNSERIIMSLDTYHDRRTAYSFVVTATGVRADYYHPSDNEGDRDYSYDPVWQGRSHVDSLGWTAEMRIPFSQLRFRAQPAQVWGVNFDRWIPASNEDDYFVVIPKNSTGWSSRFAELTGIEGIAPSRRLELLPYAASDGTFTDRFAEEDPLNGNREVKLRAGGDLKAGLGSNLTLDATFNPDFGQVEADPAEVNLTAYETFFSERRPFFIEGSQILKGNGPSYFYSRRIGAAPHGDTPDRLPVPRSPGPPDTLRADFSHRPTSSSIIGAAKLTGRLNSGLSLGFLSAVTSQAHARIFDATRREYGKSLVEPTTGYGVLRLQQEFGPSASTAGLSFTAVRRDLPSDGPLADLLGKQAYAGGADWNLRFAGGDYVLSGYAGASYIQGDSAAIDRQQRSSRRYYQRPDADYVTYDPSRTSLAGYTALLDFQKTAGAHWLWETGGAARSPGFELNDAGSQSTADDLESWAYLRYRDTRPNRWFRNYAAGLDLEGAWNYGGVRQFAEIEPGFQAQLHNFMNFGLEAAFQPRALSDELTRGGPLMGMGPGGDVLGYVNSNFASNVTWNAQSSYGWNGLGGWGIFCTAGISVRTGGRWEFSAQPRYNRSQPVRQYITALPRRNGGTATNGTRYIFSAIDQSVLSAQFRLNYAFTPDLTLELYAEPFAASGRYHDFGELSAPGSRNLLRYGSSGTTIEKHEDPAGNESYTVTEGGETFVIDQPDFNYLSFRSNLVLRWAWRPGSTFFLVWQQNRSGFEPDGRLVGPGRLWDTLSARGDNFLSAKVTWWLPVN